MADPMSDERLEELRWGCGIAIEGHSMAVEGREMLAEIDRLRAETSGHVKVRTCCVCGGYLCPPLTCYGCARYGGDAASAATIDAIRLEADRLRAALAKVTGERDRMHVVKAKVTPSPSEHEPNLWRVESPNGEVGYYSAGEAPSSAVMKALEHTIRKIARWEVPAGDGFTVRVEFEK